MNSLVSRAEAAIAEYNMLCKGDRVIVALSGGADSVSLLNVLLALRSKLSLTLMAAHLNHNLRGEESARDESFVSRLCSDNKIELFVKSVDVGFTAKEQKISAELCGRNLRYEFFAQLHKEHNAKIATAHTASDNAETLVFNLARGTGLRGMCGIVPKREYIIRPLIYATREQVEEYCSENRLSYVTDSTNLCADYTRNKIRHSVIPTLKQLNPGLEDTLTRNSKIFSGIYSFLSSQAREVADKSRVENGYSASLLDSPDEAVKTAALLKICAAEGAKPEECHIQSLAYCLKNGGRVDMPGNIRAVCKQGLLRFIKKSASTAQFSELELTVGMSFSYNSKNYSLKEYKSRNHSELLSASLIDKRPAVRTRRAGDTFTLPYRNVTKSLKKLLNELKIPQEKRDSLILVASGSTVLWCEEAGVSKQGMSEDDFGYKFVVE